MYWSLSMVVVVVVVSIVVVVVVVRFLLKLSLVSFVS